MWLTLILRNWKLCLLVSAIVFAGIQTLRLRAETAKKELAIQDLANYKLAAEIAATTAKTNSDAAIAEVKSEIPKLLEQAKTNAYQNYLAKYGRGNAACGIRLDGLRPANPVHNSEAGSTGSVDEAFGERLVIEACARDAGRLDLWVKWATENELKVVP
jgi:hypothetical protein